MRNVLSLFLLLPLLLGLPLHAAAPLPALKGLRVLVCAGYFDLLNIPAVQRLKQAGAEVRQGKLATLTWETARQYHLIITVANLDSEEAAAPPTSVQALERFVKEGGGLLFFRHFYYSRHTDAYLAPFGASMPWEAVLDPANGFTNPLGFNISYAYTDLVTANHPVTAGVKGFWYPARKEINYRSCPVTVSQDWTVLATGMPDAATYTITGLHEEHLSKPGTYRTAPPLIAARPYGAGAIVLTGISPMETFLGQWLPAYGDITLERGNGLKRSDFWTLYSNALGWLAEFPRKSPAVGQGELAPQENPWAKPYLTDWDKLDLSRDPCTNPARGVIGLHSTLSDGKASPEALIAKAKALGLQWVAFTERLEALTPEKWERLRAVCTAASTNDFCALPGWDYADATGTRYVIFGHFPWPPDKVFSEDKQRIVIPQWWFNVGMVPNGPYDLTHAPLRYFDLSMYNMFPIRTTLAGKTTEDERTTMEGYRHVQGIQDDPFPMAVEMVYDETQLSAAAGRMCTFVLRDKPGDLTKFYQNYTYYGSLMGFVSDGPIVTDWTGIGYNRITGGKWWLPGTEQYVVKLAARSAAPIVNVEVYDGPVLLRRVSPNQAQIRLSFTLPHDQQRQLFAVITDADGKRAVTGGISVRDFLNWRFMCADRGNSICDAIQVDEAGPYMTGPTAPYQRKMTAFGICAGYGERHFTILPPDLDGGMRPIGMQIIPQLSIPGFTLYPGDATLGSKMEVPLCSRDGLLQEDSLNSYFPGKVDAWNAKSVPVKIEGVQVRYRYLNITARAHDPGVILLEGSLTFERAMRLNGARLFYIFQTTQPGEGDHYALLTPETAVSGISQGAPFSATGKAVPGSYAVAYPSLWGSSGVIMLDDSYRLTVAGRTGNTHINVELADLPREMQAGETLRYRFLCMHGRAGELPNTADWERFVTTMGLRGAPAYTVTNVKAGAVAGTKFLLELTSTAHGFAGTVSNADLPVRLPARVAGMNPNWTFAWFDLDRREWHPSAIDRATNQGFFTLDTRRGAHRLFAGHPVTADNLEARIGITSDAKTYVKASVNNVTDKPMTLILSLNPALGAAPAQALTLAPGEMRDVVFKLMP
ncbi:MAG: hypothetical protein BWY76_01819 [bacterium ADurb.Bin429]|nr:MAG: hypothetical protein BWY76_01819 [bacterium ADurb.Bin429]